MSWPTLRIDGYEGISIELSEGQIKITLNKRGLFYLPKSKSFSVSNVISVETSAPTKNFGGSIKLNTTDNFRRMYLSSILAGAQDRYDQNIIHFGSEEELLVAEEMKAQILKFKDHDAR